MKRECTSCRRSFVPVDLAREESRGMESQRKAAGLQGVRFLYYHCPGCGSNDIFVDVLPREGESSEEFETRRAAMEEAARALHADQLDVVVTSVKPH
jgi:hypothetical protein